MDWVQFFGLVIIIGGLFIWNRSSLLGIRQEMKDAHKRLYPLASSNKENTISLAIERERHARVEADIGLFEERLRRNRK